MYFKYAVDEWFKEILSLSEVGYFECRRFGACIFPSKHWRRDSKHWRHASKHETLISPMNEFEFAERAQRVNHAVKRSNERFGNAAATYCSSFRHLT